MLKTNMWSWCKACAKSVLLLEEVVSKYVKAYRCEVCKKKVRTLTTEKE